MVAAAGLGAWPELVPALAAGLGAPDLATLEGSLDCLHKVRRGGLMTEQQSVCMSNLESEAISRGLEAPPDLATLEGSLECLHKVRAWGAHVLIGEGRGWSQGSGLHIQRHVQGTSLGVEGRVQGIHLDCLHKVCARLSRACYHVLHA